MHKCAKSCTRNHLFFCQHPFDPMLVWCPSDSHWLETAVSGMEHVFCYIFLGPMGPHAQVSDAKPERRVVDNVSQMYHPSIACVRHEDHMKIMIDSWFIMIQGMSHISRYGSPSRYLSDLGSARSDRSDSSAAGAALLAFHELEATADKHGKQLHGKQTTGFQWGTWCYSNEIGMASQSEDLKSMTWFHEEICGVRRFQGTCSRHRLVWPKSSCFLSLSNVETPILGYRYVRLTFAGWPDARVLGIQIGCPP